MMQLLKVREGLFLRLGGAVIALVGVASGCASDPTAPSDTDAPTTEAITPEPEPTASPITSDADNEEDTASTLQPAVDVAVGPVIRHTVAANEGAAAMMIGVVEYDADSGCLRLRHQDDPGEPLAIVWPFGTTWDDDAASVVLPDGLTVSTGQTISTGGGVVESRMMEFVSILGPQYAEAAEACGLERTAVLNATGEVVVSGDQF